MADSLPLCRAGSPWTSRLHYLPAARDVLHGDSPYSLADAALGHAHVYPPQVAFLLTPFAVLPDDVAALLALVVVAALLVGTLFILGIRDPLCYLALFGMAYDLAGIRHGQRHARVGVCVGDHLALPEPHLATGNRPWRLPCPPRSSCGRWSCGRWRHEACARPHTRSESASLLTFGLWAVLGFQGLADYRRCFRRCAVRTRAKGYSFVGIAASAGLPATVGHVAMLVVGVLLLAGCVVLARRGDEQGAFFLALAAAFTFTPILWMHYFVLLAVPLAIARPRFSLLWLLPIALWVGPRIGRRR